MKTFKLLLCLFFGIHTFACSGESTHYTLHMNEESYQFFKELENRHLTLRSLESMLWKIEDIKSEYYSHPSCFITYFFDRVDRYLQHNDRGYIDYYEMAFWLVFLYENKVPMDEESTKSMSDFLLNVYVVDLCDMSGVPGFKHADIVRDIQGISFPQIQSQPSKGPAKQISKRKQCLLL
ncbi:MAG: hypothetical protein LBD69_00545 [Puniceicoccales bacterium]|nr:hypothetical protein [Puniceicoccales bacterium]